MNSNFSNTLKLADFRTSSHDNSISSCIIHFNCKFSQLLNHTNVARWRSVLAVSAWPQLVLHAAKCCFHQQESPIVTSWRSCRYHILIQYSQFEWAMQLLWHYRTALVTVCVLKFMECNPLSLTTVQECSHSRLPCTQPVEVARLFLLWPG